ncbi:hypothetical protein NEOLEDRAFT_1028883, partial [Neolentinus lepideus HHB14362 ss-1]
PLFQEDETADIILRSTDQFDFRAHKVILSLASPLFRDMFRVGNANEEAPGTSNRQATDDRTVPMTEEKGDVVEKLLQLCYPLEPPTWEAAAEIRLVLAAAMKYQFEAVTKGLKKELVSLAFLENKPLSVFAIACSLKLNDEARIAARYTLRKSMILRPAAGELQYTSALALHRLLGFREDCADGAANL